MKKHLSLLNRKILPRTVFLLFLSILCMVFILWNGSRTSEQSNGMSNAISNAIKDSVENGTAVPPPLIGTEVINSTPDDTSESEGFSVNLYYLNIFIRKSGHLLEYTALAFLFSLTFISHGIKKDASFLLSLIIGAATACADETIQRYTEGRTGMVSDVYLDICGCMMGAFFAVCVFTIFYSWVKSLRD